MSRIESKEPEAVVGGCRSRRARRGGAARLVVLVLACAALMLARPVGQHVRAAQLLVSFADATASPHVTTEDVKLEVPSGAGPARVVPARIFRPEGGADAPGIVLIHGVHYKGIEEPRLTRFAKAVSSVGFTVMTPEVSELSGYEVAAPAIDTVGAAVTSLRARLGRDKVGVMGMSFGGGVGLLAAADPRFADAVSFVVAVGAHDDLARVSRFFVTSEAEQVDGGKKPAKAHDYGAVVLMYSHASDFFAAEDVPTARRALRAWLREERDEARTVARGLGPAARQKVERLFDGDLEPFRAEILAAVAKRDAEMRDVSPAGHLGGLRAPVFLLHGAGDTVIPSTETEWLATHVPARRLRAVLVSPAIVHVELESPTLGQKAELVHFMGEVLAAAEAS